VWQDSVGGGSHDESVYQGKNAVLERRLYVSSSLRKVQTYNFEVWAMKGLSHGLGTELTHPHPSDSGVSIIPEMNTPNTVRNVSYSFLTTLQFYL
jgi:hypothetical protein